MTESYSSESRLRRNERVFRWPTSSVGIFHPLAEGENGRQRAEEFVRFADAALGGATYEEAKEAFGVSHQQAETRKSMLEEMGLLYVPASTNRVRITPVGKQLLGLLRSPDFQDDALQRSRINSVIAWALSNSQINRPQSRGSPRPSRDDWSSCEIRPYAAFWEALMKLDGFISVDELFGALWFVHTVAEFQPALASIREARRTNARFVDPARFRQGGDLMNPRIYWSSHLSAGGTLLSRNSADDRFEFVPAAQELIETVLRFNGGCGNASTVSSFTARPYESIEEYFETVAGRECPEFVFSGSFRVQRVTDEPVVVLSSYQAELKGEEVLLTGGRELCYLQLNTPCFHDSVPDRLLRLAVKEETPDYSVILRLHRGRPFFGHL